jgi:hypothetical protein
LIPGCAALGMKAMKENKELEKWKCFICAHFIYLKNVLCQAFALSIWQQNKYKIAHVYCFNIAVHF